MPPWRLRKSLIACIPLVLGQCSGRQRDRAVSIKAHPYIVAVGYVRRFLVVGKVPDDAAAVDALGK